MRIRLASVKDIEGARAVLESAYAEYETSFPPVNWVPYLADILDLEGRADESELIVAELDERIVGCVSYFQPGSKASYPTDSVSDPWPSDWSVARAMYERMGFERVPRHDFRPGPTVLVEAYRLLLRSG